MASSPTSYRSPQELTELSTTPDRLVSIDKDGNLSPPYSISKIGQFLGTVASEEAMVALPATEGDACVRDGAIWTLTKLPANTAANWARGEKADSNGIPYGLRNITAAPPPSAGGYGAGFDIPLGDGTDTRRLDLDYAINGYDSRFYTASAAPAVDQGPLDSAMAALRTVAEGNGYRAGVGLNLGTKEYNVNTLDWGRVAGTNDYGAPIVVAHGASIVGHQAGVPVLDWSNRQGARLMGQLGIRSADGVAPNVGLLVARDGAHTGSLAFRSTGFRVDDHVLIDGSFSIAGAAFLSSEVRVHNGWRINNTAGICALLDTDRNKAAYGLSSPHRDIQGDTDGGPESSEDNNQVVYIGGDFKYSGGLGYAAGGASVILDGVTCRTFLGSSFNWGGTGAADSTAVLLRGNVGTRSASRVSFQRPIIHAARPYGLVIEGAVDRIELMDPIHNGTPTATVLVRQNATVFASRFIGLKHDFIGESGVQMTGPNVIETQGNVTFSGTGDYFEGVIRMPSTATFTPPATFRGRVEWTDINRQEPLQVAQPAVFESGYAGTATTLTGTSPKNPYFDSDVWGEGPSGSGRRNVNGIQFTADGQLSHLNVGAPVNQVTGVVRSINSGSNASKIIIGIYLNNDNWRGIRITTNDTATATLEFVEKVGGGPITKIGTYSHSFSLPGSTDVKVGLTLGGSSTRTLGAWIGGRLVGTAVCSAVTSSYTSMFIMKEIGPSANVYLRNLRASGS